MSTRRNFLRATAAATGIAFCSCGLLDAAHAQQALNPHQPSGGRRLPVVVSSKRIKTIDVHSHCHIHDVEPLLGADAASIMVPPVNYAKNAFIEIDDRLKAMDAQAVDMEVLSINPFWYGRDRDLAAKIVKIQNEKLAELCAAKPDRFAAFASLTLQAPDLAVQELETAMKKQGLRGAAIGAKLLFLPPYSPDLNPIELAFAKLKTFLPKAAERTVDTLWDRIGLILHDFTSQECANYFRHHGYAPT